MSKIFPNFYKDSEKLTICRKGNRQKEIYERFCHEKKKSRFDNFSKCILKRKRHLLKKSSPTKPCCGDVMSRDVQYHLTKFHRQNPFPESFLELFAKTTAKNKMYIDFLLRKNLHFQSSFETGFKKKDNIF